MTAELKRPRTFVDRQVGKFFDELDLAELTYGDFKSALQEHLHNVGLAEPFYRTVDEIGPDHKKIFVVQVLLDDGVIARSCGKNQEGSPAGGGSVGARETEGMIPYYLGRLLQLAGLFIMAETLIIYFGQMMPLLQGSLLGVTVFYLGYLMVRKYSA